MTGRHSYTTEERVKIVKEHIDEGKSISVLANEHGLHYNLVKGWIRSTRPWGFLDWKTVGASEKPGRLPGQQRRNCGFVLPSWSERTTF